METPIADRRIIISTFDSSYSRLFIGEISSYTVMLMVRAAIIICYIAVWKKLGIMLSMKYDRVRVFEAL